MNVSNNTELVDVLKISNPNGNMVMDYFLDTYNFVNDDPINCVQTGDVSYGLLQIETDDPIGNAENFTMVAGENTFNFSMNSHAGACPRSGSIVLSFNSTA